MIKYWLQDNIGKGWEDFADAPSREEAIRWCGEMAADPIWINDGKRRWRVIERKIEDTVIQEA